MVSTGFSEVIGSWKIMPISRPRTLPHLVLGEREEVAALEEDLPADDAPGRRGDEPHDGERAHALAAAGLADQGHRLARAHVPRHAVHRADHAARVVNWV